MIRSLRFALLSLILAAGCATAPVQEMSDARQAIRSAEVAGAPRHAPSDLASAQDLMDQAAALLEAGDYAAARRLALDARRVAIRAREQSLAQGE